MLGPEADSIMSRQVALPGFDNAGMSSLILVTNNNLYKTYMTMVVTHVITIVLLMIVLKSSTGKERIYKREVELMKTKVDMDLLETLKPPFQLHMIK